MGTAEKCVSLVIIPRTRSDANSNPHTGADTSSGATAHADAGANTAADTFSRRDLQRRFGAGLRVLRAADSAMQ